MECPVCHSHVEGRFCSECGHPLVVERLTFRQFMEGSLSAVLLIERKYVRTIRDFYRNAAQMVSGYSSHKRKYYSSPIVFFFFFATLYLVLINTFFGGMKDVEIYNVHLETNGEVVANDAMGQSFIRLQRVVDFVIHIAKNYTNYFDLGIPVVFGMMFFLFFRKQFNLAESLAFAFFFLALSVKLPAILLLPLPEETANFLQTFIGSGLTAWVFSTLKGRKWIQILKGFFCYFTSIALYFIIWVTVVYFFNPFLD